MPSGRTNPPPPAAGLAHFPHLERPEDHPHGWEFPGYLINPSCRWLTALKELYEHPLCFPASLSPEAGLLLHSLVRNARPRVVLEVGTFCSVSTHWIAAALLENGYAPGKDAVIHCFDDFGPIHKGPWRDAELLEGRLDFVKERLDKAGLLGFVRFHPGDSSTTIAAAHSELMGAGGVDFAFIDGDHTVPGATADFIVTEPVLNTGGYVVVHDTYPDQCGGHEGPRYVLDHVRTVRSRSCEPAAHTRRTPRSAEAPEPTPDQKPLGEGFYDRIDLYLAPLNYGLGLLRRLA
jgi:predicted O-methyltransferase YrrM